MRHNIHPGFPLLGIECGVIYCGPLYTLAKIRKMNPVFLPLSSLVCNDLEIIKVTDFRYKSAKLNLPGLVIKQNESYRVLDGRHRIKKAINQNIFELPFYIIPLSDAMRYYSMS
jgi:hypothetical protein